MYIRLPFKLTPYFPGTHGPLTNLTAIAFSTNVYAYVTLSDDRLVLHCLRVTC